MKLTGKNRSTRGKICSCATLSTTNPTWTDYVPSLSHRNDILRATHHDGVSTAFLPITCGTYLQNGDVVLVIILRIISWMYDVLQDLSPFAPFGQHVGTGKDGEVGSYPVTQDRTSFRHQSTGCLCTLRSEAKVNLPCACHKDMRGNGDIAPLIFNIRNRWSGQLRTPAALSPRI